MIPAKESNTRPGRSPGFAESPAHTPASPYTESTPHTPRYPCNSPLPSMPHRHVPRVIRRQRILHLPPKPVQHQPQILRPQLQVDARIQQRIRTEPLHPILLRHRLPHRRQQLHQPTRIRMAHRPGIELRLLPDQRRHQVRIQPILLRIRHQIAPVRLRKQQLPIHRRHLVQRHRKETISRSASSTAAPASSRR